MLWIFDDLPAGQLIVELLKKSGDSDDVGATDCSVENMARSAQTHVDLAREQRRDRQCPVGHDDVLQIQPMLLENTLLFGDPHRGDAVACHSSGKVSLYGGRMANERRKEDQASKDQESP